MVIANINLHIDPNGTENIIPRVRTFKLEDGKVFACMDLSPVCSIALPGHDQVTSGYLRALAAKLVEAANKVDSKETEN